MKLFPDKPILLKTLLFNILLFSATGTGLAIIQNLPLLLGFISGTCAGIILNLPVFIIVNLIHYKRRTKS